MYEKVKIGKGLYYQYLNVAMSETEFFLRLGLT
jgi:hypothetical protein